MQHVEQGEVDNLDDVGGGHEQEQVLDEVVAEVLVVGEGKCADRAEGSDRSRL